MKQNQKWNSGMMMKKKKKKKKLMMKIITEVMIMRIIMEMLESVVDVKQEERKKVCPLRI